LRGEGGKKFSREREKEKRKGQKKRSFHGPFVLINGGNGPQGGRRKFHTLLPRKKKKSELPGKGI